MSAPRNDDSSNSLFYIDKDGRKTDEGLHDDKPADPHGYADLAVQAAIARGVSREDAIRRYGHTDDEE